MPHETLARETGLVTPDRWLLARVERDASIKAIFGAEADLIGYSHCVTEVAGPDGDEVGFLLGKIAQLKSVR